jgi:hypothetical protein
MGAVERCRDAALHIDHQVVAELVEFVGGNAGLDVGLDVIENLSGETPGNTHFSISSGVLMVMLMAVLGCVWKK